MPDRLRSLFFDQHLLPVQLLTSIRNTIRLLEAELERRRQEIPKLTEENCKGGGSGGSGGGTSCERHVLNETRTAEMTREKQFETPIEKLGKLLIVRIFIYVMAGLYALR